MEKSFKKKAKGITLVALVVTIVVLLILAGVSLNLLLGENGLITKAKDARTKAAEDQKNMEDGMKSLAGEIDDITKEDTGTINIANYKIEKTESRAVVLLMDIEYKIDEEDISYEEYASNYIANIDDGPDLIKVFVDGYNYGMNNKLTWKEITKEILGDKQTKEEYNTVKEFYEDCDSTISDYKSAMVDRRLVDPEGYNDLIDFIVLHNGKIIDRWEATSKPEQIEVPIEVNGMQKIAVKKGNNNYVSMTINVTECEVEKYSAICDKNTALNIDGYEVTVPAGFAYGVSDNVKSVNTGFVITDSIDEDGNSNGNEFVWIPVDKENLTVGKTNKKMAKISSGTDYEGVLYDYEGITSKEKTDYGVETGGNREPAVLGPDDIQKGYSKIEITKESLQKEYNDMISSIKKYGGFYVARYEISLENGNAASKIASTISCSYDYGTCLWYNLYGTGRTYTNNANSVKSSMIWGSQYDAIMNFALEGADKDKVTSVEYGRYNYDYLKTGLTRTQDSINNIYDLAGNAYEWTLEATRIKSKSC